MKEKIILILGIVFLISCVATVYIVITKDEAVDKITSGVVKEIKPVELPQFSSSSQAIDPTMLSTSSDKFNTKVWSLEYTNEALGFSLTFPPTWQGYRVSELPSRVDFGIEDQGVVFSINAYTIDEWKQKELDSKKKNGEKLPGVIKKNNTHVFTVTLANNLSEKVIPLINQYPSILTTFKLK